jgi:hypothetical protein
MFSFNPNKYNFWPIYETIKKYYPLGIIKENKNFYYSYEGLIEFNTIINDNLADQNNFRTRWKSFDDIIEKKIKIRPIGTGGFAPSFSSLVEFEILKFDKLTRVKRIHYWVSLLGPYYTIVGDDVNIISVGDENLSGVNYLVISPFNEFAETFNMISAEIESHFKNYQFVPFFISKQTFNGLELPHADTITNSVFTALFGNPFDLNLPALGDERFKEESWINKDWDNTSGYIAVAGNP